MFRNINVGTKTQEYIEHPLVPDDVFAYKIVWNTGEPKSGILKVTAILSDGSVIYDTGSISSDGIATYVLANSMYSVSGSMELRLSVVSGNSVLTDRILYFNVLEGTGEDTSYAETKYLALDTLLVKVNSTLDGAESHLKNIQNPHKVTKAQVGLSNADNTSDMDKPVSSATKEAINKSAPVNTVKVNDTKKVVLPNLKGGCSIKALHIGSINSSEAIAPTTSIPVTLKSKSIVNLLDLESWVPKAENTNSTGYVRRFAYFDITKYAQDKNGNPVRPWLSFGLNEVVPSNFRIYALQKNKYPFVFSNITTTVCGVGDIEELNGGVQLNFNKVSGYLKGDHIIALVCANQSYVFADAATDANLPSQYKFFSMWLSRFKYLQLEMGDNFSPYNLGRSSVEKNATVTVDSKYSFNTFIAESELSNLYLDNSGTAELIIGTNSSYPAPTDIYVEYYEDIDLKQQKAEADLKQLIEENTAAIIANGGSE